MTHSIKHTGVVLVAIATTNQYWTSRMNGGDPSSLTDYGQDNESFTLTGTGSDGSAVGTLGKLPAQAVSNYGLSHLLR